MSDLTFKDLRRASEAHMRRWSPGAEEWASGAWAFPPTQFEAQKGGPLGQGISAQAPLPPQLLQLLYRFPAPKLAPLLAEMVRQLDRLCAAKGIDLGAAIKERLEKSPELPTELATTPPAGVPDSRSLNKR